ncbi:MAG TPA: lipocalin family protein [Terrimicrobiaceae bacterium]|nr:lipocalin family protein [Terrimicrobiaceae bacterium]
MKRITPFAAILISLFFSACATRQSPPSTVGEVDLARYAGTWFEIARYPNWFQRHCAGETQAVYAVQKDGSVRVENSCLDAGGVRKQAIGRATVVPGSGNAKLKVSFFGPFAGPYWIIGLDEKSYSWAVVGHPTRKYLWILSRTPKLPETESRRVLALIKAQGYDASRLITTPQ